MKSRMIIAHRGGSSAHPENTIAGIKTSLRRGADLVEIDIRSSQDGVPMVVHDDNLKRLFGLDRRIGETTAKELFEFRHGGGAAPDAHRIFTFEETLSALDAPRLLLHIKAPSDALRRTIDIVNRNVAHPSELFYGVVGLDDHDTIRSSSPAAKVLGFVPDPRDIPAFVGAGVDVIRVWDEWASPKLVDGIHRDGLPVWVMVGRPFDGEVGETTPERIRELEDMGMDGIIVNDVDLPKR